MAKKVYPTPQELTTINSSVKCTFDGCYRVFSSESNLMLHLAKTHKITNALEAKSSKDTQFHCPEEACVYNNTKHFKTMKLLKQHYLKVHSSKNFICENCNKGFATLAAKNSHIEYCGVMFTCKDCKASYSSYETLTTHARRKKHTIYSKITYKINPLEGPVEIIGSKRKAPFILPKGSMSLQVISINAKEMTDKSNQTELYEISEKRMCLSPHPSQSLNLQLQKTHSSVETQTIGDFTNKKSSSLDMCSSDESMSKKSIKTQTKPVSSMTKSCNTSFNISDFDIDLDLKVERNSSSTQTTTSVPTELIYSDPVKDLTFDMNSLDTETLFNCNTETQTDLFGTVDYCINMYTQTCDFLFSDFGFNNTCTQTAFDDVLRSVESQTTMSQGNKLLLSCRDMAHMETQTEAEFKQILEEINA